MNSNSDFNSIKAYILRQREKKKQEMENSKSLQKQKREEEMKRFRVKMTLEEISSELSKLENKSQELKQQKHQLFSQLKKVLHEDELRRRHRDLQWNANANALFAETLPHAPPPSAPPSISHPQQQQSASQLTYGGSGAMAAQMTSYPGGANHQSMQFFSAASAQTLRNNNNNNNNNNCVYSSQKFSQKQINIQTIGNKDQNNSSANIAQQQQSQQRKRTHEQSVSPPVVVSSNVSSKSMTSGMTYTPSIASIGNKYRNSSSISLRDSMHSMSSHVPHINLTEHNSAIEFAHNTAQQQQQQQQQLAYSSVLSHAPFNSRTKYTNNSNNY